MAAILHLPELPTSVPDGWLDELNPAYVAEWRAGRLRFPTSWPEVLAMAIRDGASSVHYHPWRTNAACDECLSYVVRGIRYGLHAPDDESGRGMLAHARRLAAPGLIARVRAWVAGSAVGRVRLIASSGESEWCVVCWGRAQLAGAEFLRLSPVPAAHATCPEAEP